IIRQLGTLHHLVVPRAEILPARGQPLLIRHRSISRTLCPVLYLFANRHRPHHAGPYLDTTLLPAAHPSAAPPLPDGAHRYPDHRNYEDDEGQREPGRSEGEPRHRKEPGDQRRTHHGHHDRGQRETTREEGSPTQNTTLPL